MLGRRETAFRPEPTGLFKHRLPWTSLASAVVFFNWELQLVPADEWHPSLGRLAHLDTAQAFSSSSVRCEQTRHRAGTLGSRRPHKHSVSFNQNRNAHTYAHTNTRGRPNASRVGTMFSGDKSSAAPGGLNHRQQFCPIVFGGRPFRGEELLNRGTR